VSSRKTKYYYAQVEERYGDGLVYDCREAILFKTWGCPEKRHNKIVRGWYDCGATEFDLIPDKYDKGWYWNDSIMYGGGNYNEISKTTFMELKNKTNLVEL